MLCYLVSIQFCFMTNNQFFIHVAISIYNILSIINRYVRPSKYLYVTVRTVRTGDYHNTPQRQSIYEFRIEMQKTEFRDMKGRSA